MKSQRIHFLVLIVLLMVTQENSWSNAQDDLFPSIIDDKGVEMVFIPAGDFIMGETLDEAVAYCETVREEHNAGACNHEIYKTLSLVSGERTQVHVDGFYMDRYEVSRTSYLDCVVADVCSHQSLESLGVTYADLADVDIQLDLPMTGMSFLDASIYCAWREGRLPTEKEWEYAASGPQNYDFAWGDDVDMVPANFCDSTCVEMPSINRDDGFPGLAPVDAYEEGQSWAGIYNLSGNANELISSRHYEGNGLIEDMRILKGGSFASPIEYLANWMRTPIGTDETDIRNSDGFRCVRTTEPAPHN